MLVEALARVKPKPTTGEERNPTASRWFSCQQRRRTMTDHKKKGDFDQWQKEDKGGDKKQHDNRNEDSRTGNQNSGHGGHR